MDTWNRRGTDELPVQLPRREPKPLVPPHRPLPLAFLDRVLTAIREMLMTFGSEWADKPDLMVKAFKRAFPDYSVSWRNQRYELVTETDANPWCVISPDPEEIWNAIKGAPNA